MDNFLTEEECDNIIEKAKKFGLESSELHLDAKTIEHELSQNTDSATFGNEFTYWDVNQDGKIQVPQEVCVVLFFFKIID